MSSASAFSAGASLSVGAGSRVEAVIGSFVLMGIGAWVVMGCKVANVSSCPPPGDEVDQDHHDGRDDQDVNESAHGVGRDESEQPQDEQDNGDRVEHGVDL